MAKPRSKRVIKRNMKKRQGGPNLYGIKQGAGRVNTCAFPKKATKRRRTPKGVPHKHALNALHPYHLPLPRAVGAYSVIRTTDIVNSTRAAMLFGCFKGPRAEFTETTWLDVVAVRNGALGASQPINGAGNAHFFRSSALTSTSLTGARMVPAAYTLQVMNGQPLQTTNGIVYIGRSKTVLDLMGDTRTWETVMEELVSYSAPRLCSAGKLALRGVQVNAIPNNMSVLSDFVPRGIANDGDQTWTQATYPADFEGLGPIFVYNPDGVALKYLITIEWRMRFDPLNPAYAGHTTHMPASESTWARAIADAESAGNGVLDIADVAADVGMAAMYSGAVAMA